MRVIVKSAHAREQGNVIGLVSVYIYTYCMTACHNSI